MEITQESLKIEWVDPKTLKHDPKNANKHPVEQIERLKKIIKYQGWRWPIIVSLQDGYIKAGHGRQLAAVDMGLEKVPVSYQSFVDDTQAKSFMTSDNAIARWSDLDLDMIRDDIKGFNDTFDTDLLGILNFDIDVDEVKEEPGCDEDEIPESQLPRAKTGDLFELGNHRLLCGDSTNIENLKSLMGSSVADLVFTDPPYGVDVVKSGMVGAEFGVAKKGSYKEIIGDDTTDTAKEFYQTCLAAGLKSLILWGGNYFTDFLEASKSWIVWNKRGDTNIQNTFADGEMAWSNLGHPVRIHGQLWNGMIRAGEKDKRVHPTQKPVALAEFCFELKKDCKSVYDGFGGSGSTLIACEKTKRKCYMIEMDPHYCGVIIERWQKYSNKKAYLLMEDGKKIEWNDIEAMDAAGVSDISTA